MNWETKSLVEVTDLITCGVAKRPEYVDKGVPFLSARNVKNARIIWSNYKYITRQFHELLTKNNKPEIGDVLYTRVGSFGEAAVIEDNVDFSIFVSLTLIKPKHHILDSAFLRYYLNSKKVKTLAKKSISSSGVGNLNVGTVRKFPIPIPPLEEQQRIVAILDEVFAGIDAAITNTEKNLANARELRESNLNNVFTQKGDGWVEMNLGDVCEVKDGTHDSPKYVEDGIPFVTQKNIRKTGFDLTNTKHISIEDHEKFYKRSNVAKGDIIISMIGVNRGMACIVDRDEIFSIKNVGLIKKNPEICQSYLDFYLKSFPAKGYIDKASRGGAQPFIGLKKLREFPIIIAPAKEQLVIAKKLQKILDESLRLEAICQKKLDALSELKQSILQKAFNGELTAQDRLHE
jgi:type I restriction enzyme, S subunit